MVAETTGTHLTVVTGEAGIGKTRFVAAATNPADTLWITLDHQRHAVDLAALLLRRLRSRHRSISAELFTAIGGSSGPTNAADALARAEQLGVLISEELHRSLDRPLTLVLDELERLDGVAGPTRLVESIVRSAPTTLSLVLVTRTNLTFEIARLRASGRVTDVGGTELSLDTPALELLTMDVLSPIVGATTCHDIAGVADGNAGIALVLAAAARRLWAGPEVPTNPWAGFLGAVRASPDPIAVASDLLVGALDDDARSLLEEVAVASTFGPADLVASDLEDASEHLAQLIDDRLVDVLPGEPGRYRCARAALDSLRRQPERLRVHAPRAVQHALGRGSPRDALAAALWGETDLVERTLTEHGAAVIADGSAQLVLDAIETLSPDRRRERSGLAGRAHQALGDWQTALAAFESAPASTATAAAAWRHGLNHYLQGDAHAAMAVYRRALDRLETGDNRSTVIPSADREDGPADHAMVAGYAAAAAWIVGDLEQARRLGRTALMLATSAGSDAALAVAHTAAALVAASDGDRVANDWHYVQALEHAERAGDALQIARIRTNQGSRLLEEGEFADALAELDLAVRFATIGGYGAVLALALTNRGEVLTKLGRLDEAREDLATAVEVLQRQRSHLVAYPLAQLGRLLLIRGDVEQARAACEEAIRRASSSDQQIVVGLELLQARTLADRDPVAATRIAQDAVESSPHSLDVAELMAHLSELHHRLGDRDAARSVAHRGIELARERRDRYALARCLEAAADADTDAADRRRKLEEAHSLMSELGCILDAARVDLQLIELADESGIAIESPAEVDARIRSIFDLAGRCGARPLRWTAAHLLQQRRRDPPPPLAVNVLGALSVVLDGQPIAANAWQSRRARTLFKMLVVRRRPIARDAAMEVLWPGEAEPATKKLSVALATLRGVLDPGHRFPSDHYVIADDDSIRLQLTNITIDVDRFISLGRSALDEHRRQPGPIATTMLAAAEALYTGDLLEDEPYVDWYVTAREEARSCYLSVTRALARRCVVENRTDDALSLYMRILEHEPYDEHAHLRLVDQLSHAGRHGDARRRYQRYVDAMRELGIEPQPFPGR